MMSRHVSPETTLWNVLQFPTIPGWIGVGVEMPLRVVVAVAVVGLVAVCPMSPTQT